MFDWHLFNWRVFDWVLPFYRLYPVPQVIPGTRLKVERIFKGYAHASRSEYSIFQDLSLTLTARECIAVEGVTLSQELALLQTLYGHSPIDAGAIWLNHQDQWINLTQLSDRQLILVRQQSIGYLSKFLPTRPHATALEVALDPLLELGIEPQAAQEKVKALFRYLDIPSRLWRISPVALSDCEKQQINIARTFSVDYPVLLLNAPGFNLDPISKRRLIDLINERKASGCAIIGVFQDQTLKQSTCTGSFSLVHSASVPMICR